MLYESEAGKKFGEVVEILFMCQMSSICLPSSAGESWCAEVVHAQARFARTRGHRYSVVYSISHSLLVADSLLRLLLLPTSVGFGVLCLTFAHIGLFSRLLSIAKSAPLNF